MYKHLFGPVPSRRLGISLGVDLVPHKVCTLNCIYCECGATTRLTHERAEYVPFEEVKEELLDYFGRNPDPDFITFSGAGEPTLNSRIGEVLSFVRKEKPGVKVALITNGTLFHDAALRKELSDVHVVLPSLDAATDTALKKINRCRKDLSLTDYVQGIKDFKREFRGEMWLEVLILPGYNDGQENIIALGEAILDIAPDRVQLNTLDRPGVEDGLRPATREELEAIAAQWKFKPVELVVPVKEREQSGAFRSDVEAVILETITRRPCTLDDLGRILDLHANELNKYLSTLEESGQVEVSRQERGVFYQIRK